MSLRLGPQHLHTLSHLALAGLLVGACVLAGCQSTPISGRKRLPLLLSPEASEMQLGQDAYKEVLTKEPPSRNQRYVEMVRRVGQRIAAVAGREDFQWEFNVIQSDQQNAFCLPGGKVAVYEGILPVCQSEAGLAVVMSHEIAHALARHGGERMQAQSIKQAGGKLTEWAIKDQDEKNKVIALAAYGAAAEYGVILPYSRTHESEADLIGLKLMAEAGYDPSEAPRFWERFAAAKDGKAPPEWLSTHPSDVRRAADLRENLPEALDIYLKSTAQHGLGEAIAVVESTNINVADTTGTRLR